MRNHFGTMVEFDTFFASRTSYTTTDHNAQLDRASNQYRIHACREAHEPVCSQHSILQARKTTEQVHRFVMHVTNAIM